MKKTPDRVLAEMRERLINGQSLQKSLVPGGLLGAANRLLGSWQAAVESLGLNYDDISGTRRWTREELITAIQKLHAEGIDLRPENIRQVDSRLFNAAIKFFPRSWAKALGAAGIDSHQFFTPRTRWSRELATKWVQTRNVNGQSILVRDAPEGMQAFLRRELRLQYSAFVESLGIAYPGVKQRHDWSREAVLAEIRTWQAAGHRTNATTIAREYQALLHQARKYFKSWDRACAAAGVAVDRPRRGGAKWSQELVASEIRRCKDEGRPLNSAAVGKDNQNLYKQARKFYGSWDAACIAAGVGLQRSASAGRHLPGHWPGLP
jgi:hypothetical protein